MTNFLLIPYDVSKTIVDCGALLDVQRLESIRHQLAVLARSRKTRVVQWTREMPTDWRPYQIRNPTTGEFFTQDGTWYFIANLLESGHPIEEIILCQPPGKRAYVMLVELGSNLPKLYIKLQLGSGKVIGRSFHYSTVE